MLECYTQKTARAKKKHTCSLCERAIEPGEEYIIYKGKTSEYGWFSEKYHPACQRIIGRFMDEQNENEYGQDSINEWLYETRCHACDKYDSEIGDWDCDDLGNPLTCPKIRKEFGDAEG